MSSSIRLVAVALALLCGHAARAQDAEAAKKLQNTARPSAEAIQAFWTYYFHGKGQGPLLAEAKLCLEVAKDGPAKAECLREAPASGVKTGTPIYIWQAFVVPQGEGETTLSVQVKHGDTLRETKDLVIRGESVRSRHWTHVRLAKPGQWTFVLLRGGEPYRTLVVEAH